MENRDTLVLQAGEESSPFNMNKKGEPINRRSLVKIMYRRMKDYAARKEGYRYNLRYRSSPHFNLTRANPSAAGLDIKLKDAHTLELPPDTTVRVYTGLRLLPNFRHSFLTVATSTCLQRGVEVISGIIDSDYSGDIFVIMFNANKTSVLFSQGNVIAQLLAVDQIGGSSIEFLCPVEVHASIFELDYAAILKGYKATEDCYMEPKSYLMDGLGSTGLRAYRAGGEMSRIAYACDGKPDNLSRDEAKLFDESGASNALQNLNKFPMAYPKLDFILQNKQKAALHRCQHSPNLVTKPAPGSGPGIKLRGSDADTIPDLSSSTSQIDIITSDEEEDRVLYEAASKTENEWQPQDVDFEDDYLEPVKTVVKKRRAVGFLVRPRTATTSAVKLVPKKRRGAIKRTIKSKTLAYNQ